MRLFPLQVVLSFFEAERERKIFTGVEIYMEIVIKSSEEIAAPAEMKKYLESLPAIKSNDLTLLLGKSKTRLRGIEPTVLVAVVGATGAGLGALIAGLFQFLQRRSAKTIIMQTASGERLEFPADMKSEEIDLLIEKLKNLDMRKITLE